MSLFVLAGHPVTHSKGPTAFAAAFRALGLDHRYEAHDVDESGLVDRVTRLRSGEIAGMNVTMPHKTRALALADARDHAAERSGAANLLARDSSGLVIAMNADVAALSDELRRLHVEPRGRAVVLGAGGAARAAIVALRDLGFDRIALRARDEARARALAEDFARTEVEPLAAGDDADVFVVVQATSAGMRGDDGHDVARAVDWAALPRSCVAYDVVYTHDTPFLLAARAASLVHDGGVGMWVAQAAIAFERWLGVPAPRDVLREAFTSALASQPPRGA